MNEVFECDTLEEMVVGVHILVEGMAHSFFMEGARASSNLGVISQFFLGPYKPVKTVFAQWLPNFIGKDESRHLAFGVHFLSEPIKNFTPAQRNLLESKIVRWGELFTAAVQDPKFLVVPSLDSVAIRNRCINNINLRLAKIGFEARIPTQN